MWVRELTGLLVRNKFFTGPTEPAGREWLPTSKRVGPQIKPTKQYPKHAVLAGAIYGLLAHERLEVRQNLVSVLIGVHFIVVLDDFTRRVYQERLPACQLH